MFQKRRLLVSGQQGELLCFTSPLFSYFLLFLSHFHRASNNENDKRHDGMSALDEEAMWLDGVPGGTLLFQRDAAAYN